MSAKTPVAMLTQPAPMFRVPMSATAWLDLKEMGQFVKVGY